MMFVLFVQGAGPVCSHQRGLELVMWALKEMAIARRGVIAKPESWSTHWRLEAGSVPWAKT